MNKLHHYIENVKFQKLIYSLNEGVLDFPAKEIFKAFNSLSIKERENIMNILNNEIKKSLTPEEQRNLLNKIKIALMDADPSLSKKFIT